MAWQLVFSNYCQTPVLGLGRGVDFTFPEDNHKNENDKNYNPHLNFVKGTVLGDKKQGVGMRAKGLDKGKGSKEKGLDLSGV